MTVNSHGSVDADATHCWLAAMWMLRFVHAHNALMATIGSHTRA